jgi:type IV secretory pathway VirB10-like protein
MSKGKSNDLLIAALGLGAGGVLAYLFWPRDAAASTIQATPLPRPDESVVQRAQQIMNEKELPSKPVPKPVAPKKPAPKKAAAAPLTIDGQLAEMRRVQQEYEVERNTAASMAMKEQIAQVLRAEILKAEQVKDLTRAASLRDQLAFMSQ